MSPSAALGARLRRACLPVGCGCALAAAIGLVAAFRFGLICFLVPCDRGVTVAAAPQGVAPGTACAVELTTGDGSRVRSRPLEEGEASFVVGWPPRPYRVRLACGDAGASAWREVEFDADDRVDLGTVALAPP